jgi:hypothetical protein
MVHIVIAGGTGFLGSALAASLAAEAHSVTVLTRQPRRPSADSQRVREIAWTPDGTAAGAWPSSVDGADAVVNLAGESIAAKRWTPAQKQKILDSRILATRSVAAAIAAALAPPPVLVNGSAAGYYGPLGEEAVTEDHPPGRDFLAHVCVQWEMEAMRAATPVTRVVCLRTGLVLDRKGGALPKMLPPFWFGAGGPVGSGRHFWPWIHRQDWVDLVRFAISTPAARGPLNATAPHPVTNRAFARALGRALRRPALIPAPAFALRMLLGEMADALLLSGQRAIPAGAERLGHRFRFGELDDALREIFR